MSNRIFRNPDFEPTFQRKGFAISPLLSLDEVEFIRNKLVSMKPDDNFSPPGGRYHCTFLDTNEDYKRQCDELFRDMVVPKLDAILHDYEMLTGNFYVKNPNGGGEFQVHQNWDTVDETKYTSVTVWIPLQDTNQHNGTIEFVEGSHKLFPDIATANASYYFQNFVDELKHKYCKPCEVPAGHAVIFDDDIIHYSTSNDSPVPRISMQLEFVPKVAEKLFYFVDAAAPHQFEVYESNLQYFIEHNLQSKGERPAGLKLLRTIPNKNKLVTEKAFVNRLKSGERIRRAFYQGTTNKESFIDLVKKVVSLR